MHFKVTHTTRYTYSQSVPVCHNEVRLCPRATTRQTCATHRLLINPAPGKKRQRVDYFGNIVDYFSIQEPHRGLTVTAASRVQVQPAYIPDPQATPPWEDVVAGLRQDHSPDGLAAYQYAFQSENIQDVAALADYARQSFTPRRPILEALLELTNRIHHDFTYDPRATTVATPILAVLGSRRGVCQDFAHVQIGCLRGLGLAARYVSGYLRTIPPPGQPRLIGADASHAWLSVYCGSAGWVDVDPTNDTLPSLDHVTLAFGRDYTDICPIRGVFVGGGDHMMHVSVDVEPEDATE